MPQAPEVLRPVPVAQDVTSFVQQIVNSMSFWESLLQLYKVDGWVKSCMNMYHIIQAFHLEPGPTGTKRVLYTNFIQFDGTRKAKGKLAG